jgi:hypothetical protein
MLNRRSFLGVIATTALFGITVRADDKKELKPGEWEKLGTKEAAVSRKDERDLFEVTSAHRFTAVSFRVDKGDVSIEDIKITFDDDTSFSPTTKLVFKEGERSGKIDLPGKSRAIKRVRFLYRTIGQQAAVVHLYGKVGEPERK